MKQGIEYDKTAGHEYVTIYLAITDGHMHPRIFDVLHPRRPAVPNGKAGLDEYTKSALLSGITRGLAMLNESIRVYAPEEPDQTKLIPYPITTVERLQATAARIVAESRIPMGMNMLVDPEVIGLGGDDPDIRNFTTKRIDEIFSDKFTQKYVTALKIFGGESTGGYMIPRELIIPVAKVWHKHNPDKPVILHVEDEAVAEVLEDWPAEIPVHIAHVSSRQELEAVLAARQNGKSVTCEATPHHLTLTEATKDAIDALGCVKPGLKKSEDVKYLREHIDDIDVLASDCAPHRMIDKVGLDGNGLANPAFGLANHAEFMPIFFGGVEEGWISERQLYDKTVIKPAEIFNLPWIDSVARFRLTPTDAEDANLRAKVEYGCSPFFESPESPLMIGRLTTIHIAGKLAVDYTHLTGEYSRPRYENLISH